MKVTRIIAAAAMSAVLAGTAQAQATPSVNCVSASATRFDPATCFLTNTVTAHIPWVARMELASATTLPTPTAADFGAAAGRSTTTPTVLTVRANAGFRVTVSAPSATWTGPAGSSKPARDLRIFTDVATTPVALSSTGVSIFSSTSASAGRAINVGYSVLYNWTTDGPGAYTLGVNYTLTSP
ncbi:hypothetical protein [Gemmatimonas sp.]|uniref:hypothetical protein n=1 Tax=Gemmatimonas sp. TaxID=1962908 RepID=UPI003F70BAF5